MPPVKRSATIRPRIPATKPAVTPVEAPDTLAAVAARVSRDAPVVGGLAADLQEIAMAAAGYRRTLIREGIPVEMADRFVSDWHDTFIGRVDEDEDEPDDELEPEPA
jgi:hypothetical protein